jgi:dynein light chain roadblock-type
MHFKQFQNQHYLFFGSSGAILQSTLSEDQSKQHGALISSLTEKASILVNTLDPDDELSFLRIRSKRKEVMVAPDEEFLMMVIQNPGAAEGADLMR